MLEQLVRNYQTPHSGSQASLVIDILDLPGQSERVRKFCVILLTRWCQHLHVLGVATTDDTSSPVVVRLCSVCLRILGHEGLGLTDIGAYIYKCIGFAYALVPEERSRDKDAILESMTTSLLDVVHTGSQIVHSEWWKNVIQGIMRPIHVLVRYGDAQGASFLLSTLLASSRMMQKSDTASVPWVNMFLVTVTSFTELGRLFGKILSSNSQVHGKIQNSLNVIFATLRTCGEEPIGVSGMALPAALTGLLQGLPEKDIFQSVKHASLKILLCCSLSRDFESFRDLACARALSLTLVSKHIDLPRMISAEAVFSLTQASIWVASHSYNTEPSMEAEKSEMTEEAISGAVALRDALFAASQTLLHMTSMRCNPKFQIDVLSLLREQSLLLYQKALRAEERDQGVAAAGRKLAKHTIAVIMAVTSGLSRMPSASPSLIIEMISYIHAWRERDIRFQSDIVISCVRLTTRSIPDAEYIAQSLPSMSELLGGGGGGHTWATNTILGSRMQFLFPIIAACTSRISQDMLRDIVSPAALLYLGHSHMPLVDAANQTICSVCMSADTDTLHSISRDYVLRNITVIWNQVKNLNHSAIEAWQGRFAAGISAIFRGNACTPWIQLSCVEGCLAGCTDFRQAHVLDTATSLFHIVAYSLQITAIESIPSICSQIQLYLADAKTTPGHYEACCSGLYESISSMNDSLRKPYLVEHYEAMC